MSLHEELHKQLLGIIAEQERVLTIKRLTDELNNICAKLKSENNTIIKREINFEELTDEETAMIKALNDKYNETMKMLYELIHNK